MNEDLLSVPEPRREALQAIADRLSTCQNIVLTTHVNADGDGTGCEAAVAAFLASRGLRVHIVNPTPFPPQYRFLLADPGWVVELTDVGVSKLLREADALFVLDTGEPKRIGKVLNGVRNGTQMHRARSSPAF